MALFHAEISARSKNRIRVEAPYMLPDGRTESAIVVRGSGWTLALSRSEALDLAEQLHTAATDTKEEKP